MAARTKASTEDEPVIVFIQCEKLYAQDLAEMLGSIRQDKYTFVLLPKPIRTLSKAELQQMLAEILND